MTSKYHQKLKSDKQKNKDIENFFESMKSLVYLQPFPHFIFCHIFVMSSPPSPSMNVFWTSFN